MKASEARKITDQNGISLTEALKRIEGQAKIGVSCVMFDNMNPDTLQRLFDLGYRVSKFTDPVGFELTKIEW